MYTGKRRINLVDEFDSSEFVHPDSEYKNSKYKLFATCKHQGSIGSGHYISYTKHRDKWYLKDDETCNEIENFPFSDYHYLILYKKII
jgi:ubiquitin C-terminal hydrolase